MRFLITVCTLLAITAASTGLTEAAEKDKHPIYGLTMKSLTGKKVDLNKYKGKVLLIVNTASECGATPQYEPLQALHAKLADKGLVIAGFPCNQFGKQEPGSDEEIAGFCKKNYGVSFDMFSKIDVNGEKAAPLFKYLTSDKSGLKQTGRVKWNFEKFLIGRDGEVIARFRTGVQPDSEEVVSAIETALAAK
ncbi:MAG: glutathione peroxidase [Planctomycetota bacterium]|jgi:glutathione peroxidase